MRGPEAVLLAAAAMVASTACGMRSAEEPDRSPPPARVSDLWISDLEDDSDLARWQARSVSARTSADHASHGRRSGRFVFEVARAPSLRLGLHTEQLADWRGYEALVFDLWAPGPERVSLTLQISDARGQRYKEGVALDGRRPLQLRVPLANLDAFLDLRRISEVELFRWNPGEPATVYLDAFRLVGSDPAAGLVVERDAFGPSHAWQVGWASSLVKLHRAPDAYEGRTHGPVTIQMARNETESFQVAVLGGSHPARVRVSVGPLRRRDGPGVIVPGHVDVRRVDYVETVEPYYPVTRPGPWPDPLFPADYGDVPARAIQPFWVSVRTPAGQPPGTYEGQVTVTDSAGRRESLELSVTVWDFELPRVGHLKTSFDLSQFRVRKAYESFVPAGWRWRNRMEELYTLYYEDMLRHRISPMLHVDPREPGILDEIERLRALGLSTFTLGFRGGAAGNNWPDRQGMEALTAWYRDSAAVLRERGLLDFAYLYAYDEPPLGLPHVAEVTAALHGADSGLRTLVALFSPPDPGRHAAWLRDVDILCLRNVAYDRELADWFRERGGEVWIYVSSPSHPYPTLVIDYPAVAARILPWMCWRDGVQGLLYWDVTHWRRDPWTRADNFGRDQNGNGALYYPGPRGEPVPSLRLALLRDGLEDYEYLHHLARSVAASPQGARNSAALRDARELLGIEPLVSSMRNYEADPELLLSIRARIGRAIEALGMAAAASDSGDS